MIPGLPAHILFMCVRYADSLNDAGMLKSLMNSIINGIKQVVKVGTTSDIGPWNYRFFSNIYGDDQMPILHLLALVHQSEAQSVKEAKLLGKDKLGQGSPRVGICQLTSKPYL